MCVCVGARARMALGYACFSLGFSLTAVLQLVFEWDEEFCLQVKMRLNDCVGKKPQTYTIIKAILS